MSDIFVVTSGEYSDYGIRAIFSTEELANRWIALHKEGDRSEFNIETWSLDGEATAENITVWRCGILLDSGEIKEPPYPYTEVRVPFRGYILQAAVSVPAYDGRLVARVESGVSAEHAEKVAVEARQAWQRGGKREVTA